MDKLIPIRSIVGASGEHDAYRVPDRASPQRQQPPGGWPALGSVLSKLKGPAHPAMPAFVGLVAEDGAHGMGRQRAARLSGRGPRPFKPDGEGKADMVLNGVTLDRLAIARRCWPASTASAAMSTPAA